MIPILQSINSLKLMNCPESLIYAKTGLTRILFLTTKNIMARKSVQSADVQTAIFQKTAPAHAVTILCRFSTRITVQRSSSCARFVTPHFFQMKRGFQLQSYNALTVAGHCLQKKERKHFIVHKCINPECPYYLNSLKKVDKTDLAEKYGKNKYKLHYIYREFTMDFFSMDLNSLPKNTSSLKFSKHSTHILSLCLTMHVNLGLSLRKTAHASKELYNVNISHQQVANYCKTAAICIKPYVDRYPYEKNDVFTADVTYIKIRGVNAYIWLIINAATRSILGYQVSDYRGVGPCILAMRMVFQNLKKLPEKFKFIVDGYSAYPLAAMEFAKKVWK